MKHEFHTYFDFALQDSVVQAYALDWLAGKSLRLPYRWQKIKVITDDFARLQVLYQAPITGYKEYARMGSKKNPTGLYYWIKHHSEKFFENRIKLMRRFGLTSSLPDLSIFPKGSWAIQVNFTLKKPYISKDDVDFYIIDNPVKKEWVFKVPYVSPSQWKGALRSTMIRELVSKLENGKIDEDEFVTERLQLYRLFGNEKDGTASFLNRVLALHRVGPVPEDGTENEEWQEKFREEILKIEKEFDRELREKEYLVGNIEGYQGSLHFYPTFFDRIGLEVINPHDRNTGAGKNPIYFECVPAGTPGVFTLLYVPPVNTDENTARADLKAVAKGVKVMLTQYGFGAKTSSGYGVAKIDKFVTRRHSEHGEIETQSFDVGG